jgi:transcriptional regulator with XRE-family HTH domain
MGTAKWFKDAMESARKDFTFRLETIILEITEQVVKAMKEKRINRSKLAQRLNVSPAFVTKILNGTSNFTLKTLLSLADTLDLELKVRFEEKKQDGVHQGSVTAFSWSAVSDNYVVIEEGASIFSSATVDVLSWKPDSTRSPYNDEAYRDAV